MNWEDTKINGSPYYKGGIEPVDLFKQGEILYDFAIGSIIKYAYRSREDANRKQESKLDDVNKIIHYACMLKVIIEERLNESRTKETFRKL